MLLRHCGAHVTHAPLCCDFTNVLCYNHHASGEVSEERMGTSEIEKEWATLMRAGIGGDAVAYRQFFVLLTPYLRGLARRGAARIGLAASEAEDVVQEVLLAIHLKRSTWDDARPIGPWISAIAHNKLIDARRRRGNRVTVSVDDFAEILPAPLTGNSSDQSDIDRLLETLPDRQKDLIRSLSIEGRSVAETAKRLSMKEGAVRVALHRAIKTLAALYRNSDP
jgi:RNA polymerase sigma factor (sigma-70 family)